MTDLAKDVWQIITANNVLNIAAAVGILVIGWLVALVVRKGLRVGLSKLGLGRKLSVCVPESDCEKAQAAEKCIAGIAYWCILLLALLGCFSKLNLTDAAAPVRSFLEQIWGYLPNVIAAAILLFAAWIVASVLKYLTQLALLHLKLDEKIEKNCDTDGKPCELSATIASAVSLLTYLFFLPAILSALKISGITLPLQNMLSKILDYLPNLFAGAVVAVAGLWAAGLLRKITEGLLSATTLEAGAEKLGLKGLLSVKKIAKPVSMVVYALVALPVIVAALDALQFRNISASANQLFDRILQSLGNVFGAVLTVFIACMLGAFADYLVKQLLSALGFNRIFSVLGFKKDDAAPSEMPSQIAGKLARIAVILFGVLAGMDLLGFSGVADLIRQFIPFAGNILVAVVVFLLGVYLSNLAVSAAEKGGIQTKLALIAIRVFILFLAGGIALRCADIGGTIVETAFALILGAVAVAAALAVGLGGKDVAAKLLQEWIDKKDEK